VPSSGSRTKKSRQGIGIEYASRLTDGKDDCFGVSQQQINEVQKHLTRDTMVVSDDPLSLLDASVHIALAFTRTRVASKRKRPASGIQTLNQYQGLAKALHKVEITGKEHLSEGFYNDLVHQRAHYEQVIDILETGLRRARSGGARNVGRETAVWEACK
jgi:hypothetical protein